MYPSWWCLSLNPSLLFMHAWWFFPYRSDQARLYWLSSAFLSLFSSVLSEGCCCQEHRVAYRYSKPLLIKLLCLLPRKKGLCSLKEEDEAQGFASVRVYGQEKIVPSLSEPWTHISNMGQNGAIQPTYCAIFLLKVKSTTRWHTCYIWSLGKWPNREAPGRNGSCQFSSPFPLFQWNWINYVTFPSRDKISNPTYLAGSTLTPSSWTHLFPWKPFFRQPTLATSIFSLPRTKMALTPASSLFVYTNRPSTC